MGIIYINGTQCCPFCNTKATLRRDGWYCSKCKDNIWAMERRLENCKNKTTQEKWDETK